MSYYISKVTNMTFDEALSKVAAELNKEGFIIMTVIDVKKTLKEKLDVDFRKYHILGACNTPFAYQALRIEDKIGLMLPCNVIVQEITDENTEVAAIDPVESMSVAANFPLTDIAEQMRQKLMVVIDNL